MACVANYQSVVPDFEQNEQPGGSLPTNQVDDKPGQTLSRYVLRILEIILAHAQNKFDASEQWLERGIDNFILVISDFVASGARIEACLPAFPFKSANKEYKVLGSLPDKAEELALGRLHEMCARIEKVYPPGARVTIISDGVTYNDLLGISDRDTWAYGMALRKMAKEKHFDNLAFSRMNDLLDLQLSDEMSEVIYVSNCTNFRRALLNQSGQDELDIDHEIATNPDTKLTYLGYRRFLESDLQHIYPRGANRTSNGYKRDCKYIAKQMLRRGNAFARAVKAAYPKHLRLSIHESISGTKISMCLLNTKTGYTTPWHCSVCQLANGEWVSAPKGEFIKDERLDLIYENDRPSYFMEKTMENDVQGLSIRINEATTKYLKEFRPLSASDYLGNTRSPSSMSSEEVPSDAVTEIRDGFTSISKSATTGTASPLNTELLLPPPAEERTGAIQHPPYGRRLLPQVVDDLAIKEPERIVFSLATSRGSTLEFQDVSAREFANAIDRTAWWIQSQIGTPEKVEPIGYIGPHDLRHILLTYASVKVGYAALFLSPKNSADGVLAVLEKLECNFWAQAGEVKPMPMVQEVMKKRRLRLLQLPPLNAMLSPVPVERYPYNKTFQRAKNEAFCFLHTSGTTGNPKPIIWSHALIGTMDAVRLLPPVDDAHQGLMLPWTTDWISGDTIYSSFPMSHGAGIIMDILMPALFELRCVLGPAGIPSNTSLLDAISEATHIDIWSLVPSLVDELGQVPDVLAKFKRSKFICASGGPVNPDSAGKVNEVIRVLNLTGTTEGLFIGNLVTSREDWYWFCFHPYSGFEFKQVEDGDGSYEHWIHRNEHCSLFQGIFHTFPEKDSINFKDLYKRHPTRDNLWAFLGRSDDLVVLSNGYKITPLEVEGFVSTHPMIKGCLVFGTGRPRAGLLIDLKDGLEKTKELLESIWNTVKKANSMTKNQLQKDFVTFSEPGRAFVYTDKMTVKRAATLAAYEDYIDRFYQSRLSEDDLRTIEVDVSNLGSTQTFIQNAVADILPQRLEVPLDANLFELGLDSLGVFAIIKTLRAATRLGEEDLAPHHLYGNPNVRSLATIIVKGSSSQARSLMSKVDVNADASDGASENSATALARHKARQSFPLNAFDYVNPNHGMGLMFFLSLRDDTTSREEVFKNLQDGLNRTFDLIPALSGKVMHRSAEEIGYTIGDLCVNIPPLRQADSVKDRLVFKDLSGVLPSFDELKAQGFPPAAFKDSDVLRDDPFPKIPADIIAGQVSFLRGGCVVAVDINHTCLDGVGAMVAVKAWAENCRYLQGDTSATCAWYHPESFNHSLPEIVHHEEGWARSVEEIDHSIWNFLPFFPPEANEGGKTPVPQPSYPLHSVWPLPRAERCLSTTLFLVPKHKVEQMKQDVMAQLPTDIRTLSISDIMQAFFWRAAIKARYRLAREIRKQAFPAEATSVLELPTDGRPYFGSLPSTYMGSLLLLNRTEISLENLCAPETSIGSIASALRQSAARFTPSLVHDAFTVLQSLPDHSRFSTANMGLEHMNAMISNMLMFPMDEISFGSRYFGNAGSPEAMRPQLERGAGRFRFLVIFPMRPDGGVELVLGTHPEELEMLQKDEDFIKYAELIH